MQATFQSERLIFSPVKEADVPTIYTLHSFKEVAQFNTIGIPENEAQTRHLFAKKLNANNKDHLGWVMHDQKRTFIGEISLILASKRFKKGEISYSLFPEYWGKGFATEAVKRVFDFAFNSLQLHRVEAGVAVENEKSIRVLEKAGMKREGRHQKILPLMSGWSDNFSYAILSTDFKLLKQ